MNPYEPVDFEPPTKESLRDNRPNRPLETRFDPLSIDQIAIKLVLTILLGAGLLIGITPFLFMFGWF